MKTIVYIGGELPDKDASALRIIANAKALRDYGYNVVLISQRKGMPPNSSTKEEYDGFTVYFYPFPCDTKTWFIDLVSIKSYVEVIEKETDVVSVVCYNFHTIALERLIKYCHRRNIYVISDCTEWHTVTHLHGIKKIIKKWDVDNRINKAQRKSDGLIAISTFFEKMYNDIQQVVTIPPLIDKKEDKWRNKCVYPEITRFVYAGRMGIGKDSLNTCLSAFSKFSEKRFVVDVVGVNAEEYLLQFPEQKQIISKLAGKINFHGMLPHEEALEFVKRASFSLLIRERNTKNESGFPTKFVESIACGTPVIATDFSDVRFYIDKYGLGIMVEDEKNLEQGFIKALEMPREDYLDMRRGCNNCSVFDFRNNVDIIGNFVDSIVGRGLY